jgi:hypothetical protein
MPTARTATVPGRRWAAALLLAGTAATPGHAEDFKEFSSQGLPRSQGIVVRVSHPPQWRKVPLDDEMAIVELRGPHGGLTGILQIGRGRQRNDIDTLCKPDRARTMLAQVSATTEDARVTDVMARTHQGRPAYEIRYERKDAPDHLVVRSVVVCLKDSQLVVSCAGAGGARSAVAGIEPVCSRILESVSITED